MMAYHSRLRRAAARRAGGESTTDPFFGSVVLLNSMDTAPGTDDVGKTFTASAGTTIDTGTKLYGTGSARTDTYGERFTYAGSADWTFPGDFTIEASIYPVAQTPAENPGIMGTSGILSTGWDLLLVNDSASVAGNTLMLETRAASVDVGSLSISHTFNYGQWYRIAVQRSGTTVTFFVEGVPFAGGTNSNSYNGNSNELWIGTVNVSDRFFNGNIDEVRITKGVARYNPATGYTPRTTPFPRA